MVAIITGDIIGSRKENSKVWLSLLKEELQELGNYPKDWEIFRGDSFQIKTEVENALKIVFLLKSKIKQISTLDVRFGIGIGKESFLGDKITESNGDAYIRSGEIYDNLKNQTILFRSGNQKEDQIINILLKTYCLIADKWSVNKAEQIYISLKNPDLNQQEIAHLLGKKQGNLSLSLKKSGYYELKEILDFYTNFIN